MWNKRRAQLEHDVVLAVLNLFQHMGGASSFMLPLDEKKQLVVLAGPRSRLASLLSDED